MVQNLEDITVTQTCQTQQQQQKQQQQQWLSEDSHYPQLNHRPKLVKMSYSFLTPSHNPYWRDGPMLDGAIVWVSLSLTS